MNFINSTWLGDNAERLGNLINYFWKNFQQKVRRCGFIFTIVPLFLISIRTLKEKYHFLVNKIKFLSYYIPSTFSLISEMFLAASV